MSMTLKNVLEIDTFTTGKMLIWHLNADTALNKMDYRAERPMYYINVLSYKTHVAWQQHKLDVNSSNKCHPVPQSVYMHLQHIYLQVSLGAKSRLEYHITWLFNSHYTHTHTYCIEWERVSVGCADYYNYILGVVALAAACRFQPASGGRPSCQSSSLCTWQSRRMSESLAALWSREQKGATKENVLTCYLTNKEQFVTVCNWLLKYGREKQRCC